MNERRTRNTMKLLAWLQRFHPEMHAAVIERVGEAPPPGGLAQLSAAWEMTYPSNYYAGTGYRGRWHNGGGLGQNGLPDDTTNVAGPTTWWQDAITGIKEAGVAYLQYDAQKDIIALQTKRIEQGKEPLDTSVLAPTVRVQADIPEDIKREIAALGKGAMTWLMLGGVGLVAWMMLRK